MLANWSAHGQPGYVEQAPKSYGTWVIGDHGEHCRSPQPAVRQPLQPLQPIQWEGMRARGSDQRRPGPCEQAATT